MGNSVKSLFCSVFFQKISPWNKIDGFFVNHYVFKIPKSLKGTSHTNSNSEWENENFEICKFKGLL
jgi:hypothetical protein